MLLGQQQRCVAPSRRPQTRSSRVTLLQHPYQGSPRLGTGRSFRCDYPSIVVPSAYKGQSGGQGLQAWNPVEVVKREQGLQSNKLPTALRERVSGAVEELRFRVTVGDVAARAGVKLSDADTALKALAYDAQATLEVSEQGDVVYSFPRNFQSTIQGRSLWLKLLPLLQGTQKAGAYLLRVLFGTALFFSVAIVWFAIAVLMSSSRDRNDRRDGGGGYYNGYYGNYSGGGFGPRIYFDLTDLFIWLDPNYSRTSHERVRQGASLTFLEAIFSFVFGDGDPNAEFDTQRWAALGSVIQSRGGVVTAEEMAPFLDPPNNAPFLDPPNNAERNAQGGYADESFVLPALIRFGGEPVVDEATGQLIYQFPSLQATGVTQEWVRSRSGRAPAPVEEPPEVVQEGTWELTAASPGQVLGVVALGALNVVGVLTLGGLLADPAARYTLTYQGLGWVTALMPALQVYAASFFGIPAIRMLTNMRKNAAIIDRNSARAKAARLLSGGARWIREKLAAARRLGQTRTVRRGDAIFTTDKEATQQLNEREESEWDKRFASRADSDSSNNRGQPVPRSWQQDRQRMRDFDGGWR